MCPIKKRYFCLIIPVIIAIGMRIYYVNNDYEKMEICVYEENEEFEHRGMNIRLSDARVIEYEEMESLYGDNKKIMDQYVENKQMEGGQIIAVNCHIENLTQSSYDELNVNIGYGTRGNGIERLMTESVMPELSETPGEYDITLFFRVLEKWNDIGSDTVRILFSRYPKQEYVKLRLRQG